MARMMTATTMRAITQLGMPPPFSSSALRVSVVVVSVWVGSTVLVVVSSP